MQPIRLGEVFVSDITYIKNSEKTHYLLLVTEAYSCKIMSYQLSDDMQALTGRKGLQMAADRRLTALPLIHHSDCGFHYCSSHYQYLLSNYHVRPSMQDEYDCFQNALAEKINVILKQD